MPNEMACISKYDVIIIDSPYFLSLMQMQYKIVFLDIHIVNPKMEFQDCFQWFGNQYDHCSEQDRIKNKEFIKREWNIQLMDSKH